MLRAGWARRRSGAWRRPEPAGRRGATGRGPGQGRRRGGSQRQREAAGAGPRLGGRGGRAPRRPERDQATRAGAKRGRTRPDRGGGGPAAGATGFPRRGDVRRRPRLGRREDGRSASNGCRRWCCSARGTHGRSEQCASRACRHGCARALSGHCTSSVRAVSDQCMTWEQCMEWFYGHWLAIMHGLRTGHVCLTSDQCMDNV